MKLFYTTIPIALCKYALKNRKPNHLKLYIYLKLISSGHVKYSSISISAWATDIGMSERWTKDVIKWMISKGWITVNSKRKSYRIISYKQLCKKLKLEPHACVLFENDDFTNFRQFLSAAVITDCLKIKRIISSKNRSGSRLTDSSKCGFFYSKSFHPLPISYIAKKLGVTISTANNIKCWAIESRTIFKMSNTPYLLDGNGEKLGMEHWSGVLVNNPTFAGRLRKGKFIRIVEADLLETHVLTKRKRYKY
jgi:hypothetical protein